MKMNTCDIDISMFAPCGMNCKVCYKHCYHKKPCAGCLNSDKGKPEHCRKCRIKDCVKSKAITYCYECLEYPCKLVINLDRSYNKRYQVSLMENSKLVKELGIKEFMEKQKEKYTCPKCQGIISMHDKECSECQEPMIKLRLLDDCDIPLIERWLHKEHVKKWYEIPHLGVTLDDWMMEIKERNHEYSWLHHFVVMYDGKAIGLCQYYKCIDSDEDFGDLQVEGTYGIDYLIGEESCVGKGVGKLMIKALIDKIFSLPDALRVTADIDESNKASEGVLLSCGFVLFDAIQSRYVLHK